MSQNAENTPKLAFENGEYKSENMALYSVELKPIQKREQQCHLPFEFVTSPGSAGSDGGQDCIGKYSNLNTDIIGSGLRNLVRKSPDALIKNTTSNFGGEGGGGARFAAGNYWVGPRKYLYRIWSHIFTDPTTQNHSD